MKEKLTMIFSGLMDFLPRETQVPLRLRVLVVKAAPYPPRRHEDAKSHEAFPLP